MNLSIDNTTPALSADHQSLGAAVKILIAGGSALGDEGMRRASGVSAYVWTRKGEDILALVTALEKPTAAAG